MSKREKQGKKRGVVVPFATLPTIQLLPDHEAKELFVAMLTYGQGDPPQITSPTVAGIWPTFARLISDDDETYASKVYAKEYSGYCSGQDRANKPKLTFEQWQELNPLDYRTLDERIAAQTAPPEPPHVAQEEAEPEEAQDTADTLTAALGRWMNYKGYPQEQAPLILPRLQALERTHGAAAVADAIDQAITLGRENFDIEGG